MKKLISILLVLCTVLSLSIAVSASEPAQTATTTVYLSDNGNDENSGADAQNSVKTITKAFEKLGSTGGIIMIPDVYTYPTSSTFYVPYTQGASYIVRGVTPESRFVQQRGNIAITNPYTFDNLTYELCAKNQTLRAYYNRLEFTSTVTVKPYNDGTANYQETRQNYLIVYGGEDGKFGDGKSTELILNGGTYNYIYGGCANGEMMGGINVTVGGTANIMNRIYLISKRGDVYGDVKINITGGRVGDKIICGGDAEPTYCSGNIYITVTGGTVGGVQGASSYTPAEGEEKDLCIGQITVDMTKYEPSAAENYRTTAFVQMPESAKIYLYGETLPGADDNNNDNSNDNTNNDPDPSTPGSSATPNTESKTDDTTAPETTAPTTETAIDTAVVEDGGCGSSIAAVSAVICAATAVCSTALLRKKED